MARPGSLLRSFVTFLAIGVFGIASCVNAANPTVLWTQRIATLAEHDANIQCDVAESASKTLS